MSHGPDSPLHFRARHRLAHDRQYQAVLRQGIRKIRGPIIVTILPNALEHPRLGLAVGVRAGSAVVRSRLKRLIREVFRLHQHRLPRPSSTHGGYDILVGVRSATGVDGRGPTLAQLTPVILELVNSAHAEWQRRAARGRDIGQEQEPA